MAKNQEQYKQELIKEMQNKKAFGVIKVHIQDGNINKINAHITEEITTGRNICGYDLRG